MLIVDVDEIESDTFTIQPDHEVSSIGITVGLGSDPIPVLLALAASVGAKVLDRQTERYLDPSTPSDSWNQWVELATRR